MKLHVKNKKALAMKSMIVIIIGLTVLISFLFFQKDLAHAYNEKEQKLICKHAVEIGAATKIKGSDFLTTIFTSPDSKPSDIPCPVNYDDKVSGNAEEIKEKIALKMYDSWDMMHQGRLDMFSSNTGEERYCILTDHIKFRDAPPKVEGFPEYLRDKPIPRQGEETTDPKEKIKYAEFLQCHNTRFNSTSVPVINKDFTIDTEQDYGIMFLYSKEGYMQKIWAAQKGIGIGAGVSGAGIIIMLALTPWTMGTTTAVAIIPIIIGGSTGYIIGSEKSADWQACIMLFPYNEKTLKGLNCTYMPGVQGGRLQSTGQ